MEEDPIRRYQSAKREADAIEDELRRMGESMKRLGEALTSRPVRLRYPRMITRGEAPSATQMVGPEDWPDYDRFEQLLDRYYAAQAQLGEATGGLSREDRKLLNLG